MKTIVRLIIVAVVVLGAQSSHASNPHPSIAVRVLDAENFAIYMRQITDQKLRVAIKDDAGHVLYSKTIRKRSSFNRKMNLKELPAGQYTLEIRDDIGTLSYPIALAEGSLEIPEDKRVATFNPIIKKTNNTVSLALFSPAKHSHELSIYNERNELIHGEKIEEKVNYNKQFDFSEALPGDYSIVVNSQGHQYTYLVPVK
jgi:hypothetical protein